jgi:hypothetical protein
VLEQDKAEPVDHAWLMAQRARACTELGDIEQARTDADAVQRIRISHPNDSDGDRDSRNSPALP